MSKYTIESGLVNDDFMFGRITVKVWYDGGYPGIFKYYDRFPMSAESKLMGFSDTRNGYFGKYSEWRIDEVLAKPIIEAIREHLKTQI